MTSSNQKIFRVAITGPESTGKSTLAKQLADHYETVWVPEYAREYLDDLGRPYEERDLVVMTKGQLEAEEQAEMEANKVLICDTELIVFKIWSEHKYGKVDPFILTNLKDVKYDLYLLTDIDLPWAFDPQREHPDKRVYFFKWFKKELKHVDAPVHIIGGKFEERLKKATNIIDSLF